MNENKCSICLSEKEYLEVLTHDNYKIKCQRCGEILISGTSCASLERQMKDAETTNRYIKPLLSHWLRKNYNKTHTPYNFISSDVDKVLKYEKLPDVFEQTNNLILYIGSLLFPSSDFKRLPVGDWIASIGSINENELLYIQKILYDEGYLRIPGINQKELQITSASDKMGLTFKGWGKYNELKSAPIISNQVFVAMWFNDATDVLRDSLKAAIIAAGYDPLIVDERHFTGNIMDYVIGQIKQSKFIIADFTVQPEENVEIDKTTLDEPENTRIKNGTRGGVYFESGYAKGLGLKVIQTCKAHNISKNRLHFDIVQENTLFWKDHNLKENKVRQHSERIEKMSAQNFAEQVYDRIISIFGHGNNSKKTSS